MNNINFHSLKTIPVPEELRKKVIAIPENNDKGEKRVFYLDRFIRFAAAAASLVIITTVCIVLFRNMGNTDPLAVQPSPKGSTEASTYYSEATQITPSEYSSTTKPSSTEAPSSDMTSPTERNNSDPTDTYLVEPSRHGTDAPLQPSAASTSGTESGMIAPTNKPTSVPADPTTALPTEVPTEKQAPWGHNPPTEIPWVSPTVGPWKAPTGVSTQLMRSLYPADGKVYCRIETLDGEVFGNSGLFDKERLMTNLGTSGEYYIYYYRSSQKPTHLIVSFMTVTETC